MMIEALRFYNYWLEDYHEDLVDEMEFGREDELAELEGRMDAYNELMEYLVRGLY